MLILLVLVIVPDSQGCDRGWFGPHCQYKCHDINEDCTGDCVPGWFGPDCQYADLMFTNGTESTPHELRDGDHINTCIINQALQSVTLTLTQAFPFTWMRLRIGINDLNSLLGLNMQLKGSNGENVSCSNMRKIPYGRSVLDVYCDGDVAVKSVTVTGEGVKSLCTVNFNGGRNVALKENATQSSVFINNRGNELYGAAQAVNGNNSGNFLLDACTGTFGNETVPYWRVDFTQPRLLTRYVLYNRRDAFPERLHRFTLTSYAANNTPVFTHRDQSDKPQTVYTAISVGITTPVSYVVIRGGNVEDNILTICEVETYGDSVCVDKMYGRECSDTCSSSCGTSENICEVSTGACSQCQPGKTGYDCGLGCPNTYHGSHCQERCSTNCVDQICNGQTGYCVNCPPGKVGNLCDQDCGLGTYGINCSSICDNCKNTKCDLVSGDCTDGCKDGYKGSMCDQLCDLGQYGPGCSQNCSTFCNGNAESGVFPCHHVTGSCSYGCQNGYSGTMCGDTEQSSSSDSGSAVGVGVGIGLGVAAVIVVIGIVVYCYRRRSSAMEARRRQIPEGYDPTEPTTDEHKYSDLFKTADDYNMPTDQEESSATTLNSPPDTTTQHAAQYVNADVGQYEDLDEMAPKLQEQDKSPKTGQENAGYANTSYANL